ncbi:MAG: hypothetical protein ABL925_21305, partial [Methylococcales bacterium]
IILFSVDKGILGLILLTRVVVKMKIFRSVSVSFIIVACFFLSGFKKPNQHHQPKSKTHQSLETSQNQQKVLDLTVPTKDLDSQKLPEL